MHAPNIQHHVTDAGPPNSNGVLNVVAILEQSPMMLNAKLICECTRLQDTSDMNVTRARTVARFENSLRKEGT